MLAGGAAGEDHGAKGKRLDFHGDDFRSSLAPVMRALWPSAICFVGLVSLLACQAARPTPPEPPPASTASAIPRDEAPAVAAAAAPSASAPAPIASAAPVAAPWVPRHTAHQGPLPAVPPAFSALRDVLRELGQLTFAPTSDNRPAIACGGCLGGAVDRVLHFAAPPLAGSFTAKAQREIVLEAMGDCGRQGRRWGCLVVIGDTPNGRGVLRVHPAREGADRLLAHRIEGDRDLLVGIFGGSQQNAVWTDAFAVDFAPTEPVDQNLVSAVQGSACGDGGDAFVTSAGEVTKVESRDVDKDGLADLVVGGQYGERLVGDYFHNCGRPQTPVKRAFSYVFLRKPGAFEPDDKTRAAGSNKANLLILGGKKLPRPGEQP